jgi:hypothetical protein
MRGIMQSVIAVACLGAAFCVAPADAGALFHREAFVGSDGLVHAAVVRNGFRLFTPEGFFVPGAALSIDGVQYDVGANLPPVLEPSAGYASVPAAGVFFSAPVVTIRPPVIVRERAARVRRLRR